MKKSGASQGQSASEPQQFWQVETFEESEVLRDSAPEQVRQAQNRRSRGAQLNR
jgi:hypothetical protein